MGQVKDDATRYIPIQHPPFCLKGCHPDWEVHPSWTAGIEALNSFNFWVSEVVLPIAFQWIEEHHDEVYAGVSDEHKADVGVVIAAAFEIVKTLGAYQKGLVASAEYEQALADGSWEAKIHTINPVWTRIAKEVRKKTEHAFEAERPHLKETIR